MSETNPYIRDIISQNIERYSQAFFPNNRSFERDSTFRDNFLEFRISIIKQNQTELTYSQVLERFFSRANEVLEKLSMPGFGSGIEILSEECYDASAVEFSELNFKFVETFNNKSKTLAWEAFGRARIRNGTIYGIQISFENPRKDSTHKNNDLVFDGKEYDVSVKLRSNLTLYIQSTQSDKLRTPLTAFSQSKFHGLRESTVIQEIEDQCREICDSYLKAAKYFMICMPRFEEAFAFDGWRKGTVRNAVTKSVHKHLYSVSEKGLLADFQVHAFKTATKELSTKLKKNQVIDLRLARSLYKTGNEKTASLYRLITVSELPKLKKGVSLVLPARIAFARVLFAAGGPIGIVLGVLIELAATSLLEYHLQDPSFVGALKTLEATTETLESWDKFDSILVPKFNGILENMLIASFTEIFARPERVKKNYEAVLNELKATNMAAKKSYHDLRSTIEDLESFAKRSSSKAQKKLWTSSQSLEFYREIFKIGALKQSSESLAKAAQVKVSTYLLTELKSRIFQVAKPLILDIGSPHRNNDLMVQAFSEMIRSLEQYDVVTHTISDDHEAAKSDSNVVAVDEAEDDLGGFLYLSASQTLEILNEDVVRSNMYGNIDVEALETIDGVNETVIHKEKYYVSLFIFTPEDSNFYFRDYRQYSGVFSLKPYIGDISKLVDDNIFQSLKTKNGETRNREITSCQAKPFELIGINDIHSVANPEDCRQELWSNRNWLSGKPNIDAMSLYKYEKLEGWIEEKYSSELDLVWQNQKDYPDIPDFRRPPPSPDTFSYGLVFLDLPKETHFSVSFKYISEHKIEAQINPHNDERIQTSILNWFDWRNQSTPRQAMAGYVSGAYLKSIEEMNDFLCLNFLTKNPYVRRTS